SVRSVVDNNGNVVSAQDYYPYGELLRSYNASRYLFTEKERDTETSYDYFGARYYNNKLGMWLQVDPLSEKYPGWSPYNYSLGNPVRYIDTDGKIVSDPITVGGGIAIGTAVGVGVGIGIATAATIKVIENSLKTGEPPTLMKLELTAIKMGLDLYNQISSWFSSEETDQTSNVNENIGPTGEPGNPNDNDENRHGAFKEQVSNYKNKSLTKAEKSLKNNIKEHEDFIKKNPDSKAKKHWEHEIRTWKEQLNIIQEEIETRGIRNE
ncbi:MAG: RHS repeat-associated core domain-containing protein, partial [Bacteroidota bacterium]